MNSTDDFDIQHKTQILFMCCNQNACRVAIIYTAPAWETYIIGVWRQVAIQLKNQNFHNLKFKTTSRGFTSYEQLAEFVEKWGREGSVRVEGQMAYKFC